MINSIFGKVTGSKKKGLLKDFSYEYDQVVGWSLTRFEIGYLFLLVMLVSLRYQLNTMGNRKTMFDFMEPAVKQE